MNREHRPITKAADLSDGRILLGLWGLPLILWAYLCVDAVR